MKSIALTISLLLSVGLVAQSNNITGAKIRAEQSLRIGTTSSPAVTGFDLTIPATPTDTKLPTTKCIVDWVTGQVTLLGGRPVSTSAPTTGQVLKWSGSAWAPDTDLTGGGGGAIVTDATLSGDGSAGTPLKIAQQSATTSKSLAWTGATWEPSWGNPTIFVTSGATITTDVNEILIGTISAHVTFGLPACDAATDQKRFKFVRNGTDAFSVTIDPSSTQTFYDGTSLKISYGKLSTDCTCRFSAGTGVWFFDNF